MIREHQIYPFIDNLMSSTEEQVITKSNYAKTDFIDSIQQETNSQQM